VGSFDFVLEVLEDGMQTSNFATDLIVFSASISAFAI
jgi:hypothetical protein